ncbi:MAG TPA: hypothetical protein VFV10_19345 [Gammaproteobacteria bacterium]|nr:hypothetical protein [Gammaproteobacteria bacterium]
MKVLLATVLVTACALAFSTAASAQGKVVSDAALIKKLERAAPADIVANATIMKMMPDGGMQTVREGKNGWTCLDMSGTDPMCADAGAMEWAHALMSKGPAPQKLGFIYMLNGDAGASNTDPFATGKTADNNWVVTGPHVMIVGAAAKEMMQGYPRGAKADPSKPYVMWPGTPYEHLMLPVK